MDKRQRSYNLEHCRKHCSKAAQDWTEFYQELEEALNELNLLETLEERFQPFHFHHIPKIALAGCPNGCSQPQIKDLGVTGFITPQHSENFCSGCQACVSVCLEQALTWKDDIFLQSDLCLSCGECIRVCPTGKITSKESGWKLSIGGRLGRHPQIAKWVGHAETGEEVKNWILGILQDYKEEGLKEERLTRYLDRRD